MNRKSVFGPVVLIVLGALLLAHNFWPEFSLFRVFAAHWPWILIGWGTFRLVEFAAALIRRRPAPPPLGGGAFVLALLLVVAGSIAHSAEYGPRFRRWDRLFLRLSSPPGQDARRVKPGPDWLAAPPLTPAQVR
jgi:hypothetical protein